MIDAWSTRFEADSNSLNSPPACLEFDAQLATRLLKNAVCHPASATEHDEDTGIASLADFTIENFKEATWASSLRSQPGNLGKREVAFFALRLVTDLGWVLAGQWGLKLKGAKRPQQR